MSKGMDREGWGSWTGRGGGVNWEGLKDVCMDGEGLSMDG